MSRGNITRRGKRSWRLKFDVGIDAKGKRKIRYVTVNGTRQDAQKELTRLLAQHDTGTLPDPSRATISEHVRAWIDGADIQPKTRERYRQLFEQQIEPHLGGTRLQRLRPREVDAWHKTLLEKGGKGGQPLAPRTVGHAHRVLHAALEAALKAEKLTRNVAAVFSPPKVDEEEIEILDAEQVPVLLEAIADHALGPIGRGSPPARGAASCWR